MKKIYIAWFLFCLMFSAKSYAAEPPQGETKPFRLTVKTDLEELVFGNANLGLSYYLGERSALETSVLYHASSQFELYLLNLGVTFYDRPYYLDSWYVKIFPSFAFVSQIINEESHHLNGKKITGRIVSAAIFLGYEWNWDSGIHLGAGLGRIHRYIFYPDKNLIAQARELAKQKGETLPTHIIQSKIEVNLGYNF